MTAAPGREDQRVLVVTTTVGSEATATALARSMVEQRVAACVQVDLGVTSFYRWKGELCEDREARLVIKTAAGREAQLMALLARHHPYELPQFVAMEVSASPEYVQWVLSEVSATGLGAAGPGGDAPAAGS